MKILTALTLVLFTTMGCGGGESGNELDSTNSQVQSLIESANAINGRSTRPTDIELPLVIRIESTSEAIDKILAALERIELVAGYQLIRRSIEDEPANITIKAADFGCLTSIPLGNWKYVIEVGDLTSCPNVTYDLISYKIFGLNRTNSSTYQTLKTQSALADSAIATIYNNPPDTAVNELTIIHK